MPVGRVVRTAAAVLLFAACRSGAAAPVRARSTAPTLVETGLDGRVSLAGFDGTIVRTIVAPSRTRVALAAMRAPDGSLFVEECTQPDCGRVEGAGYAPAWRDMATGRVFAGDRAAISPDGSRIAVVVLGPKRTEFLRQYEIATGRTVNNVVVATGNQGVIGLDWTPDGRSLVVDRLLDGYDGKPDAGGLYVVGRDARALPQRPAVADQPVAGHVTFFSHAAVLADGHVIAFESTGIEHMHWPGALVDVDLSTGTVRTLLGSATTIRGRQCTGTVPVTAQDPCDLDVDSGSIAARANEALFNDEGQLWLYNGRTSRLFASLNTPTAPTW